MPSFLSWRSLIFWTMIVAIVAFAASQFWLAAISFGVSVFVWIAAGFPAVFQVAHRTPKAPKLAKMPKVFKPTMPVMAEVVTPSTGSAREDLGGCYERLDPKWAEWLARESDRSNEG